MRMRFSSLVLLLMLAGLSIPQTGTQFVTPAIRRVGDKLACKCGSCNNTIATCQMLQCHYSLPARERIGRLQAAGASDQEIIDGFVKELGLAALAVPPAQGFNLLGWVMPFAGIGLGLALIALWMKRFRRPAEQAATSTPPPAIDETYRARIEKEMAELD